jgi:ABC-type Fe3+-hydroxamate transport system substrate-binding protein
VHVVDGSAYFSRPGPRIVDSLEILAELLHPELFASRPRSASTLTRAAAV